MERPPAEERPLCECHGEAMLWAKDPRKPGGGYWRCLVWMRAYQRKYYQHNREKILEHQRKYWAENQEKRRERKRKYYAENREKECEYQRKYRAENQEKTRERNARRMYAGEMYLGMCGFTNSERRQMLDGSSD